MQKISENNQAWNSKFGIYSIVLSTFISVIVLFFIAETALRIKSPKNNSKPENEYDKYLGWKVKANFSSKTIKSNYGHEPVDYSTTQFGFRVFGDIHTQKTKIFVIGDSFTQAKQVSDGQAYYNYLQANNKAIEIFAYGGGGYGSLQEYMVLKKYYDLIKPDIILWQFCSNDFINNDLTLESTRWANNNPRMRPFYRNGQIEFPEDKRSAEDNSWLGSLMRHSYLLRRLFPDSKLSKTNPLVSEALKTASKTTAAIMQLVKEKFAHKTIVAFLTDRSYSMGNNTYANISENLGFHFIRGIPEAVSDAKKQGIQVDGIHDFHWSAAGHAIAGKNILDYLIKNNLLMSQPKK